MAPGHRGAAGRVGARDDDAAEPSQQFRDGDGDEPAFTGSVSRARWQAAAMAGKAQASRAIAVRRCQKV
jgi:hypothetical protein